MNKVPVSLFILWAAGLVGIVVFSGLYMDSASQGNGWLCGAIASGTIFLGGIVWYFTKGNKG